MKKKRFMGLLALLSCATLVTGCELSDLTSSLKFWEKKEKESGQVVEEKFTVSFDANGGSGSMASVADVKGDYSLPACGFTAPSGKKFAGWKVGGEGDLLQPGAKISVSANVSLVAQWEEVKFTVSFSANGGSGSMASVPDQKGDYVLPQCGFTAPEGKVFAGWKVNGSDEALQPGNKISVSANVTLVAQWVGTGPVVQDHTVSFSANGGSGSMESVKASGSYELPQCGFIAPEGKVFAGWKVGGSGDLLQPGSSISVSADVTLVAQWKDAPAQKFTVSFSAGGGSGEMASVSEVVGSYVLPQSTFIAPEGKVFAGWKIGGEGELLQPGSQISVSADVTLVAQWAEPEAKITISGLPEKVYAGDEIDLKQYVELENAESFSTVIDAESASIASASEDNVISVFGEGAVSFTVKVDEEHSASASVEAFSHVRENLLAYFEGVGNQYTVQDWQYFPAESEEEEEDPGIPEPPERLKSLHRDGEEEPGEGEGEGGEEESGDWDVADIIVHDKNYILSYAMGEAGFLRFGENDPDNYFFERVYDSETEYHIEVDEDIYSPSMLENYNSDFVGEYACDLQGAAYSSDEEGEVLVLSGNSAAYFAWNTLFAPGGNVYEGSTPVAYYSEIQLELANVGTDEEPEYAAYAYCFASDGYTQELHDIAVIYVGEVHSEYFSDPVLNAYCVAENKPELPDFYHDFIYEGYTASDFLLGPDSKWMGSSGRIDISGGWYDYYGDPIEGDDLKDVFYGFGQYFPTGEYSYLTSENSFYRLTTMEDPENEGKYIEVPAFGKTVVDDKIYTSYFDEGEVLEAQEDSSLASVWDSAYVFGGLHDPDSFKPGTLSSLAHGGADKIHAPEEPVEPGEPVESRLHRDGEEEEEVISFSFAPVVAAYAEVGIELEIPDYKGAEIVVDDSYLVDGGYVFIEGSNGTEMGSFATALDGAGWTIGPDESGDYDYYGYYGETGAEVYIGDWSAWGLGIFVHFYIPSLQLDAFPIDEVNSFIRSHEDIYSEFYADVVEYTIEGEEGYYELDMVKADGYYTYYDFANVYAYGSSGDEMGSYKDKLVEAGWVVVGENEGDYRLQYAESYTFVDLIDNTADEDDPYILISFYVPVAEHQSEINSWRAQDLFSVIYAGLDGGDMFASVLQYLAFYYDMDIEQYFDAAIYVSEAGTVEISIEFQFSEDATYLLTITETYDPSAAIKCTEYDALVAAYLAE